MEKIIKSDPEWKQVLTDEEYRICREKGTERAFAGEYWQCAGRQGIYNCRCCGSSLFEAEQQYDSGSGWPSFSASVSTENIETKTDNSLGMLRTEVLCSRCDAHLGHVFSDGPGPDGLRYCINSASLKFHEKDNA